MPRPEIAPEASMDVVADLRRAKLPANLTRVHILTQIRALDAPITPDALCQRLDVRLSRVSVYRVLAELARADLVTSFPLPGGKIVYSANRVPQALRLTCPQCGQSAVASNAELDPTLVETMANLGYSDKDVLILAVCQRCIEP